MTTLAETREFRFGQRVMMTPEAQQALLRMDMFRARVSNSMTGTIVTRSKRGDGSQVRVLRDGHGHAETFRRAAWTVADDVPPAPLVRDLA